MTERLEPSPQAASAATTSTRYKTIVIDPPWRYRSSDILTRGRRRAASIATAKPHKTEGHYATLTNTEIAALPVGEIAADDAQVYLWVTNPHLYGDHNGGCSPVEIIEGWGFRYITLLTWVKTGAPGLGFYFRSNTEHVLFGVRGNAWISPKLREPNVITAPRGVHSAKPDAFYDMVERVSPEPRLEMFARRARLSGWDYWGDESLGTAELPPEAA